MVKVNTNLSTLIITTVIVICILSLVVPTIILPYVKPQHIQPEGGIDKLSFGEKFLNLMYFMSQAPLLIILVMTVLVVVSILLGSVIKI